MAERNRGPMILRHIRRETKYVTDRFRDFSAKYPELPQDFAPELFTCQSFRGHIDTLTGHDFSVATPPSAKRLALVRVCDNCLVDIANMMEQQDTMYYYDADTVNDDVVDAIDEIRGILLTGVLPPVTNLHPGQGPIVGPPMVHEPPIPPDLPLIAAPIGRIVQPANDEVDD
jgi:hypothetical protein